MITYETTILKFQKQGEKTGWTYLEVPLDLAQIIKPNYKKSFRVKGKIDRFVFNGVALLPMGGGSFIMALNASMRKGIGKRDGAMVKVLLEEDKEEYGLNPDLINCLADEPEAMVFFKSLSPSHQRYFSKWVEGAKTAETLTKRITSTVNAMMRKQTYAEMIRAAKK